MGELHLEVSVERLRRDFGVDVSMGRMMVAYQERPRKSSTATHIFDKTFEGKASLARIGVEIEPTSESSECKFEGDGSSDPSVLQLLHASSKGDALSDPPNGNLKRLSHELVDAISNTVATAFGKGPILGNQIMGKSKQYRGAPFLSLCHLLS